MKENELADIAMDSSFKLYHRFNDNEEKWIVSVDERDYSDGEILDNIRFQEQCFESELQR